MEQGQQERADTLYEVADALLSLGSNYSPTITEIRAHVEKIETPLRPIPTERLLDMMALAAEAAAKSEAPKAPTAPGMLAVWQSEKRRVQPSEFLQGITQSCEAKAALVSSDPMAPGACQSFLFSQHGHSGKPQVRCNCSNFYADNNGSPYVNMFAETIEMRPLAALSDDLTHWICAGRAPFGDLTFAGPCGFRLPVDEGDAMLLRIRAQETGASQTPRTRERPAKKKQRTWKDIKTEGVSAASPNETTSSELAEKARAAVESKTPEAVSAAGFKIFLSDCDYQSESLSPEDAQTLRGFYDWCQQQTPIVNPHRTTFESLWNEYAMDLRAAAEMEALA